MHFGFALDLSDIDLLNIDLLDQRYTHLDLLDTISPVNILFPRRLEDFFKTCLQDVFKTCLQNVIKTCLQDVFKTSST